MSLLPRRKSCLSVRGQVCQRESARPQPQLLGIVDRLQILEGGRVGETLCRSRSLSTPPAARFDRSTVDMAADRPILERSDLVLACAHVLHTNGQSTHETVQAAERLGTQLGLRATMIAHWEELELRAADGTGSQVSFERGSPTGMNMDRVASAMSAIENCAVGRPPIGAALENIKAIAHAPPAPTWLFTLAAAAGAAAMAAIFGVHHLKAVVLIMVSAAAGAVLRRTLARYSVNTLLQPLCAALLAGMIGALAVRYNLSSSLRLVAVCPCMILIPGPQVLKNGAMDVIAARINVGASRLVHAGLIILAISVGLLLGMGLLSVSLPVGEPGKAVPLWLDVIAAGVAVAAFSVFFSTPLRMLGWPVAIGMLAHAVRWGALKAGAGVATGALVACLLVGGILAPALSAASAMAETNGAFQRAEAPASAASAAGITGVAVFTAADATERTRL